MCDLQETFAGVGENYNFTGLTGSTMNSHRLTYWAGEKGGCCQLCQQLHHCTAKLAMAQDGLQLVQVDLRHRTV